MEANLIVSGLCLPGRGYIGAARSAETIRGRTVRGGCYYHQVLPVRDIILIEGILNFIVLLAHVLLLHLLTSISHYGNLVGTFRIIWLRGTICLVRGRFYIRLTESEISCLPLNPTLLAFFSFSSVKSHPLT
jgi:hypothetical protein